MKNRNVERKNKMRALNTYTKLMRAAESITARTHRHLSSKGLTISQFGVLEALYHLGPLSQKEIELVSQHAALLFTSVNHHVSPDS